MEVSISNPASSQYALAVRRTTSGKHGSLEFISNQADPHCKAISESPVSNNSAIAPIHRQSPQPSGLSPGEDHIIQSPS